MMTARCGAPILGSSGRQCARRTRGSCWLATAFAATSRSLSWSAPRRPASLLPTSCSVYMVSRAMISGLFLCAHVTGWLLRCTGLSPARGQPGNSPRCRSS